ncbi:MAG: DUF5666 domain-containing protein [Chloroflexota bacterium]
MNRKTLIFPLFVILILVSLALVNVRPAAAQEPTPVEFTGTVASVDELTRSFVVETEDGRVLTVFAPTEFDLASIAVGDIVEIEGTLNEDGSIAATSIVVEEPPVVVEISGFVVSVDELAGSFVVEAEDTQLFTVFAPEGFDLTGIAAGDLVIIHGVLNEDGSIAATDIITLVEFTGTVVSLDELNNSFVIETRDGLIITVFAPAGFDWASIAVGDEVTVAGTPNEEGTINATAIAVQIPEDEEPDDETTGRGYYCSQSEVPHPFGARLAERYAVDYATVQAWFCEGFGWGQVMLALQTGQANGADPAALLAARSSGAGWGQIWREMGLVGRPEDAGPPNDEDGDGRPDRGNRRNDTDEEDRPGNGNGRNNNGDDEDSADPADVPDDDDNNNNGQSDRDRDRDRDRVHPRDRDMNNP